MAKRFGMMNWLVIPLLRSPLRVLLGGRLAVLTVTGRKTGRTYSFPTMCAQDADGMVVVAAYANEKSWWKNLREEAPITVELDGRTIETRARALIQTDAERGRALRRYVTRFSSVAKPLGIRPDYASVDDSTLGREATSCVVVRIAGAKR